MLESKFKCADSTLSNSNVERPALLLDDSIPVPLLGAADGYKKERPDFVQRSYTTKTIHPRIGTPMNFPMLIVFGLLLFGSALAAGELPIIGAIRWDAWYGEKGPVKEVERSLGPIKYHFRLPFFARVLDQNTVSINGDSSAIMEQEIAFATQAGLAFWAFVDYGDQGELTMARKQYQAEPNKRGLRFCFVEEGGRLDALGTNAWPRLVRFFQSPDYQRVLEGRPLLFVFGAPKRVEKTHFQQLTEACLTAGLKRPYLVFMGWHPEQDAKIIQSLGFDAWSAYAAGGQYSGAMLSFEKLTAQVRNHYWEACRRLRLPTITFATTGWDTRPRLEHPVSWMPLRVAKPEPKPPTQPPRLPDAVTATPDQLASHVRDAMVWTQANRDLNPANAMLLYAWNENDEGGWLVPTLNSDGSTNVNRISALNKMLSIGIR
jgi:hypothetical protein